MVATQTTTIREISEMRKSGETIFLKNNSGAMVTCNQGKISLTLGPVGSSNAIAPVDSAVLDVRGVQRMILKGKLTASTDPDFNDEYLEQLGRSAKDKQDSLDKFKANIEEPPQDNDLAVKKCLISGKTVTQTQRQINAMEPPLAPEHKHLAGEFVPSHVQKDGKMEVTFVRRGQ